MPKWHLLRLGRIEVLLLVGFLTVYLVTAGPACAEKYEQTAFANPRISDGDGAVWPTPLSSADAARLAQIFRLDAEGQFDRAAHLTAEFDGHLLLGTILADRLASAAYPATHVELQDWIGRFGGQSGEAAIQARLEPGASARASFSDNFEHGLRDYRAKDFAGAESAFRVAERGAQSHEQLAAALFWAGRTATEAGRPALAAHRMLAAAEFGTFYGAIARRSLTGDDSCQAEVPLLSVADADLLLSEVGGQRLFALLQVGEQRLATEEFATLWLSHPEGSTYRSSLQVLRRAAGLLSFRPQDRSSDLPILKPWGGFVVDRALVYAVVHHESNFKAGLTSTAGARGLMQIKPQTARGIGDSPRDLLTIGGNLAVGQHYLKYLAGELSPRPDLLRLLAAYAKGAEGMRRIASQIDDGGDPLLFIEFIPDASVKRFITDVLRNSWLYANELGLSATSQADLAAGLFPRLSSPTRNVAVDSCRVGKP